jgi:hypothetical protein
MQLQFEPLWLHFTLMMADGYGGNDGGSFAQTKNPKRRFHP